MSHLDEERLTALLDGELSDFETRQAREHLASCAECTSRFNEVKDFFSEADRLVQVLAFPPAPAPVAAPLAPVPVPRKRFPFRQLAWAASLFLAVGLGYYGSEVRLHSEAPVRLHPDAPPEVRVDSRGQPAGALQKQSAAGALHDSGHAVAHEKTMAATNAPAPSAAAPATPPAEARQLAAKGELDKSADKDVQLGGKRAEKSAPSTLAESAAANAAPAREEAARNPPIPRDAAISKQPLANELPTTTAGGAPAGSAEKSRGARLADTGAGTLRRGRAEAEGQSLAARSDLQKEMPPAPAASAGYRASPIPAPVRISMEQAVQALGGTIHLIDGMSPDRVEQLSARAVLGAHGGLPVIRVIYLDAPMREIWLDQQRGLGASAPRDTIIQWTPDGGQNLQWMTGTDDWLSLTAHLTADSLKVLARGVR